MRSWTVNPSALMVVLLAAMLLVFTAGCGASEESSGKTEQAQTETAAQATEKPATDDAATQTEASKEEGTDKVTTTLTIIPGEKGSGGKAEQIEIPYLPAGEKIATLETTKGTIKIQLWEDKAPNTVKNFIYLANSGKYDGVDFHRVIDGFMAQTGDVEHRGGYGGPGYSIPAEFDKDLKHERGVVSMARSQDPDSAGSQFFIMFASAPHLNGQYTAFGKVIEGMDVVDKLNKGEPPAKPDKILKARVESVPEK